MTSQIFMPLMSLPLKRMSSPSIISFPTTLLFRTQMLSCSMALPPSPCLTDASCRKLYLYRRKSAHHLLRSGQSVKPEKEQKCYVQSILLWLWLSIIWPSLSPAFGRFPIFHTRNIVYLCDSCNSANDAYKSDREVPQYMRCNCWWCGHIFRVEIGF